MTLNPPFYLHGQAGKALGAEGYTLAALGINDAVLKLRSLAACELTFSLRDNGRRPAIPDDNQWLTLKDDSGQVLFVGLAKRSYQFPERIYRFSVSSVYKGLLETPLKEGDRAYVLYPASDLGVLLTDILARAAAAGLSVRAPETLPDFYPVPKMAFRAAAFGGALEDALKWVPDTVTRMDYSTAPPTLRFFCRGQSPETVIDLDADGHKTTVVDLTPYPEARALSVTFAYARRDGDNIVNFLVQTAGDDGAEASRNVSLYLSGQERESAFVTEALTTAQKAVAMAQASVDAVGASIDAAAASAQIPLTWASLLARDSNLQACVAIQSDFEMGLCGTGYFSLYNTCTDTPPGDPSTHSIATVGVALRTSGGALASGWYPIVTGAFTAGELATAGATKETRYITGDLSVYCRAGAVPASMTSIHSAGATTFTGYSYYYSDITTTPADYYYHYEFYPVNIAVDAINMAPTAVAAAVKAAAAGGSTAFIERAEFVEAPPDLAQHYFERQDWTPYKGRVLFSPTVPNIPLPGDFLSFRGEGTPADWHSMKVPVYETSIDLRSRVPTLTIGPSPRMDFSSLVDRLRIPAEDNTEPG
jgi:hypothetical protein